MQFTDAESDDLRAWIIKRLTGVTDADSDTLADYILALLQSDEPEDIVLKTCSTDLPDFLGEHTQPFIQDVFAAVHAKTYLSTYVPPPAAHSATSAAFQAPSGPAGAPHGPRGGEGQGRERRRKRSDSDRNAHDAQNGYDSHYNQNNGGDRAIKQSRRGGAGRGGRDAYGIAAAPFHPHAVPNMPGYPQGAPFQPQSAPHMPGYPQGAPFQPQPVPTMPALPQGFPSFDPNDPMAAVLAMQAMGFPGLPGFPQPFGAGPPAQNKPVGVEGVDYVFMPSGERRCRSYVVNGYCPKGAYCPQDHGPDAQMRSVDPVTGTSYDPANPPLLSDVQRLAPSPSHGFGSQQPAAYNGPPPNFTPQSSHSHSEGRPPRGQPFQRGSGIHRGTRGLQYNNRGGRAQFSSAGPNTNTSIKSVVVEQIPQDKFSEDAVREFFSEFGTIEEVTLHGYKRLAIIRYDDYAAARRAYDSPKVIFDNRFVKVYWYKPEDDLSAGANGGYDLAAKGQAQAPQEDAEMIDPEEFAEKQAAAQKAYEEKLRKTKEAESAREALEAKIKAQGEERKKLMEKLAKKATTSTSPAKPNAPANGTSNPDTAPSNTTTNPAPPTITTPKPPSQTDALRAKLAELEAEAANLGVPTDAPSPSASSFSTTTSAYPQYSQQSYRGRGAFPYTRGGRGRGGIWRGGASTAMTGGAVARLDNRPRTVEVRAKDGSVDFGDKKVEESLRAHLFGIGEFASLTPSSPSPSPSPAPEATTTTTTTATATPTRHDAMIVVFNQRYVAEIFIAQSGNIPGIGGTKLTWLPNASASTATTTATASGGTATTSSAAASTSAPAGTGVGVGVVGNAHVAGGATTAPGAGGKKLDPSAGEFAVGGLKDEVKIAGDVGDAEMAGIGEVEGDYDVADEDEDRWMR